MSQGLNILWLKSGPLHPLDTGGKIRTYNMLRELKRKHELTYLALCPPETQASQKNSAREFSHRQIWIPWMEPSKSGLHFFSDLGRNHLFSKHPFVIDKYHWPEMTLKIRELDSSSQFDLIVCDFLTPAVNLFRDGYKPKTPTLLFEHNVESLIWKRLWENAGNALKRLYFKVQWRRMEAFERKMCLDCDSVVGVSDDDCRILRTQFGLHNVLGSVPTGVDLDYFCPTLEPRKSNSLVFLGSMDWMPNVDAICYFVEAVLPEIKKRFPSTTVKIVGRNPTQKVKDLANTRAGIIVTGTVPDVRPHLAESEIMIVPLRVGGGTRIKIYEGMATGIPIVSTRIGAEGLRVTHCDDIFLADSSEEFSSAIVELFENAELRKRIGANGRALVQQRFGWDAVTKVFEQYCFETCARYRPQISA